jgi:cell division topological specificity factor
MGILDFFRSEPKNGAKSAKTAKERLQIVIAHERSERGGYDFLPKLRQELLYVVRKYVPIDDRNVSIAVERDGDLDVLELNIVLPDKK